MPIIWTEPVPEFPGQKIQEDFKFMSVFVIGSLNIDSIYDVRHFVRPGETLSCSSVEQFPGGKGLNQAIAAARAGSKVKMAGCIGQDGLFLKEVLEAEGIDTSMIRADPLLPSGRATIQRNPEGENCILLSRGSNHAITEEMIEEWLETAEPNDYLLLQNEISNLDKVLSIARKKGLNVLFNPAPMSENIKKMKFSFLNCLILNESEARDLLEEDRDHSDFILPLLYDILGCPVLMTRGASGADYYSEREKWFIPVFPADVKDTTGAGDTFTGVFAACQDQGMSVMDSLSRASAASSLCIEKPGAAQASPYCKQVEERIDAHPEVHILPRL